MKRSRWPLIVAILAPPVVIVALVVPAFVTSQSVSQDMWVGATSYGPASTAPPAEIQAVHAALHDIGEQCLSTTPDLGKIGSDVELIIAFSRSYPTGRFPIDDETANVSSLLLVTKEAVKTCAPAEVDRIDAARE